MDEVKTRLVYEDRCDERLKTTVGTKCIENQKI
jgi:hypothetical protein